MQEINYGFMDASGAGRLSVLPGIQQVLSKVFKPAVHALENWGALGETPHGKKTHKNFLDSFEGFMQYVGSRFSVFPLLGVSVINTFMPCIIEAAAITCQSCKY